MHVTVSSCFVQPFLSCICHAREGLWHPASFFLKPLWCLICVSHPEHLKEAPVTHSCFTCPSVHAHHCFIYTLFNTFSLSSCFISFFVCHSRCLNIFLPFISVSLCLYCVSSPVLHDSHLTLCLPLCHFTHQHSISIYLSLDGLCLCGVSVSSTAI